MSREPSMEEILSSIRRVIARDEAARETGMEERFASAVSSSANAPVADHSDGDDDDVLDLTEIDPEMTLPDLSADQHMPAAALVSPDSEDAARNAIGQLTAALDGTGDVTPAAPAGSGGPLTVEAMAEAALRPMLKAWLDANLPPLVERLVAQEIARITGKRL